MSYKELENLTKLFPVFTICNNNTAVRKQTPSSKETGRPPHPTLLPQPAGGRVTVAEICRREAILLFSVTSLKSSSLQWIIVLLYRAVSNVGRIQ